MVPHDSRKPSPWSEGFRRNVCSWIFSFKWSVLMEFPLEKVTLPPTQTATSCEPPHSIAAPQPLMFPQLEGMQMQFLLGNFKKAGWWDIERISPYWRAWLISWSYTLCIKLSCDLINHGLIRHWLNTLPSRGSSFSPILHSSILPPFVQEPVEGLAVSRRWSIKISPCVGRPPNREL